MTIISPSPVLEENSFSEDELELLLDYIFELKTDFIQDFYLITNQNSLIQELNVLQNAFRVSK